MKRPCLIISVLIIRLVTASNAFAFQSDTFRCSTGLVKIGDKIFEVTQRCGEPISKETVGYTLTERGTRELEIKEWIYGPQNGVYYYLTFHGTTLVQIESRKDW